MQFTKDNFLSRIDIINNTNYNYGNDILYQHCGVDCLPKPGSSQIDTKLSSIIWLIGKAYSADPTRSAAKGTFANKGLGSSFESIAKGICVSKDYNYFYHELLALCDQTYSYQYEKDQSILQKTAELVAVLNGMITTTMQQAAEVKKLDKEKVKNVVSFSSKFLHFMCPNLFFIIDSYSINGGIALFSGNATKILYIADKGSPENICIDKTVRDYFKKYLSVDPLRSKDLVKAKDRPYYMHCLRCYHLACFLSDNKQTCKPQINGDPNSCYMPRLVDSIMMRITE